MRSAYRVVAIFLLLTFLLSCLPAVTKADEMPADVTSDDESEVEIETERPELELSSAHGTVGTKVYVTIHGFIPNQSVEIYFSDITEPVKTWPADEYGYLKTGFRVPEYPAGRYRVVANDGTNNLHLFFELESQITVDKSSGLVGDAVSITGMGFSDDDEVKLYLDSTLIGTTATDAQGSFVAACTIPESGNGVHILKAEDAADNLDTVGFDTRQSIKIQPEEGTPGTEFVVTGSGFHAGASVSISLGDKEIGVVHSGDNGSFMAPVVVPGGASGVYEVKADDGDVRDYAGFTLTSAAGLSASGDYVGAQLAVTGNGFLPDSVVVVAYDGISIADSVVGGGGSFTITFLAPRSKRGEHIVTATDGLNTATMTFTMESSAPASPVVLSPSDGCTTGKRLFFDWDDVRDPSGTLYQFEIAADAEFTDIVVSERALLVSEYLLTEETPLPRMGNGGAYYWRVKAVDFAGNEGPWSGVRSLRVGFTFEMPTWAILSIIAIVVLFALFVVGWFVRSASGRRHGGASENPEGELGVDDIF
jgi:hypothetical protein